MLPHIALASVKRQTGSITSRMAAKMLSLPRGKCCSQPVDSDRMLQANLQG
jgi:hypothetical protein